MADEIDLFLFGLIFAYLHPNCQTNQIFKKMKKIPGDIIIYTCVPKIMIRLCTVPEIWCATDGQKK